MSKLIEVSSEDISNAYRNFTLMFYSGAPSNADGKGLHFWAFIGMKYAPSPRTTNWEIPSECVKFVKWLAGPHHKALAKVMLLNGHQYKIPVGP